MIGNEQEILYTIALTRLSWSNMATTLFLYQQLGGAKAVYDHRHDIRDVLPECSSRLAEALCDWQEPLARAERELAFIEKHDIQILCLGDDRYPQRLANCPDAPVLLYYMGTADLNQRRVIDIVGTRHCTSYGADLIRRKQGLYERRRRRSVRSRGAADARDGRDRSVAAGGFSRTCRAERF